MVNLRFDGLCPSSANDWMFWSSQITWDTPWPNLTQCFLYTIVSWVPVAFLWLSSIFYIPWLWRCPSMSYRRRGKLNIFKSIIVAFIFFLQVLDLSEAIGLTVSGNNIPPAVFLQAVLVIVSSILLIYVNRLAFLKGVHSSGVLFFYWLLQLISSGIFLYSQYSRLNDGSTNFRTVTVTIEFILVLVSFISNCFADLAVFRNAVKSKLSQDVDENRPLLTLGKDDSPINLPLRPCPETQSSFLAALTFMWLTGLIVQGFRKAITSNDLFALKNEDTCNTIIPKMEEEWDKEIRRIEKKTEKRKDGSKKIHYTSKYKSLDENNSSDDDIEETSFEDAKVSKKKAISPSYMRALFHTVGYMYTLSGIYKLIYDLITFIQPQLLGLLIAFIENRNEYNWHGYFFTACLFLVAMFRTVIFQQYWHGCYVTGMRARTAIIGLVYRKALKLSSSSRKNTTVGEIVNLMSVDAQKIQDVPGFLHLLWSAPIIIVLAIYFLWQELGASVLSGLGVMILLIPVNGFIGSKVKKLQGAQMKIKDNRIKLMSEILSGIKILKLYAWELSFENKIKEIREKECRLLRSATYLNAVAAVSWFCAPFLVALSSFATYLLSDPANILTANKAFVSLSLFNILNYPMSMLPGTIVYGIQAYVSVKRINKFLLGEELDTENIEVSPPNEKPVKVVDGNFSWGLDEPTVLNNINLEITEGSLVAVVGTVGSGKSSLVGAMLGEMNKIDGRVMLRGSVAYVPQQAWCLNASVQDNITFSKPMSNHRYNRVLEACALLEDLKILPAGDETEVGEKGINLSGGQKQRISLARAVYQDASIYILDDPLSAVDAHVGKHIFNQVIGPSGLLNNKTRILVTHGLTYLPKVDKIIVMSDGKISEIGTYKELLNNNGAFADFIRTYLEQEEEEEVEEDSEEETRNLKAELRRTISHLSSGGSGEHHLFGSAEDKKSWSTSAKRHRRKSSVRLSKSKSILAEETEAESRKFKKRKLIEEEVAEIGGVKFSVFISYLRSTTFLFAFIVIFSYALYMACSVGANLFLSSWSEQGSKGNVTTQSRDTFLAVYGGLGLGQTIFILIENFGLAYGTYLASRSLHHLLLENVLRAPNSFFDTTPLGRILNRIGKDIDTVDVNIPTAIRIWMATAAGVIGTIIVVCIASPYFLIVMLPLGVFYYLAQRFYICTSRQLKRIDSIKRSPIYSHFQESIVGASSIRAYKVNDRFINKCDMLTDENQMAWYPNLISYRWLQFNLEAVGNLIILMSGVLAVLTKNTIGGGLVGLSVSYALQVTGSLNFMVRMTCDLESYTVAVERIKEYAEIEAEAPWDIPERKPPAAWPTKGQVEFSNYSVRYRPGLDLVLRNVNLVVGPGEKLGIVGRTGAGKSSMALGLFRLIEPAEGTIYIDDVDIAKIGLHDLRSKITIIPQDPVLFSGTLRMNLDPFNCHSDGELWTTLELAHLKSFVTKCPDGLDFLVSEGGENLSVGQRQLVCLARALLKKTKFLVLDEATAAVDLETDELIQNSIRRQFKSCTVLTIAHRLNTIMDYDRVMVLEQGRIKELDSPTNLLQDDRSIFYGMAKDAGLV